MQRASSGSVSALPNWRDNLVFYIYISQKKGGEKKQQQTNTGNTLLHECQSRPRPRNVSTPYGMILAEGGRGRLDLLFL